MYYLWGKETSNCKFDAKTGLAKAGEDPDIYQRWVEEKKGGKGWGQNWEKINIESCYKRIKPLYCFFRLMDGVKSWGSDWVAKDPVFFFFLLTVTPWKNVVSQIWRFILMPQNFCGMQLMYVNIQDHNLCRISFQFLSPVVEIIHHYAKVRKKSLTCTMIIISVYMQDIYYNVDKQLI